MATEIINISGRDLSVKEYKGQRVVTFKDIDAVHGRPEGTARKRFADNREHFIEGEDYFIVKPADLENTELSEKRTLENSVNSNFGTALITEQGYLMLVKSFTDDLAWKVQRQLVNSYFRTRQVVNTDLSPQMQMLYGMLDQMAQTERQAREAKEIAEKAIASTEAIKEAVQPITDNWREVITHKVNRIQANCDKSHSVLWSELYQDLERRGGCRLNDRLRNRKSRMEDAGCTKTEISKANKLDVIEGEKRLREIFSTIVSEYEIKYCA